MTQAIILNALTGFDIPLEFAKYMVENWDVLAASAYANYLRQGKGLLWLDWLNKLPITAPLSQVSVIYCTPRNKAGRSILAGANPELFQMINRYNPEDSIIFRWSDGTTTRTRTFTAGTTEPPIGAYNRLKGRLSEFEMFVRMERY